MAKWIFEPGHTAAGFRVRHMMICWVRGHFKDVHGSLEFDPDDPLRLSVEATMQASKLWTGDRERDEHLRTADFLDTAAHPVITFETTRSECAGTNDYRVFGNLTIRGVSKPVALDMHYLGRWRTPYWADATDAGPVTRVGFVGEARINRHDFQVSWNGQLENEGVVVGEEVFIQVDVEALLETELKSALAKAGAA